MREEAKNTIRKYRAEFEKMKLGDRDATSETEIQGLPERLSAEDRTD